MSTTRNGKRSHWAYASDTRTPEATLKLVDTHREVYRLYWPTSGAYLTGHLETLPDSSVVFVAADYRLLVVGLPDNWNGHEVALTVSNVA